VYVYGKLCVTGDERLPLQGNENPKKPPLCSPGWETPCCLPEILAAAARAVCQGLAPEPAWEHNTAAFQSTGTLCSDMQQATQGCMPALKSHNAGVKLTRRVLSPQAAWRSAACQAGAWPAHSEQSVPGTLTVNPTVKTAINPKHYTQMPLGCRHVLPP